MTRRQLQQLAEARKRNDRLAVAVLEGGRRWVPEPMPERMTFTRRLAPVTELEKLAGWAR